MVARYCSDDFPLLRLVTVLRLVKPSTAEAPLKITAYSSLKDPNH
jgi:hypothetical protein